MSTISYLVPARFLSLISQLVIVIMILLSRNANVEASLPLSYNTEEYKEVDVEFGVYWKYVPHVARIRALGCLHISWFFIALSLTLVLLVWELLGFFSGATMFNIFQSLLSTIAHICGSITSVYFVLGVWPVFWYWYIFGFCNVIPALIEFICIIQVHCFHRGF